MSEKTNPYKGITHQEMTDSDDESAQLFFRKDDMNAYNGQWRNYSVNKIAGLASKHVDAIEINGERISREEGMEKSLDIINYGRMLYLKYKKGDINGTK